MKIRSAVLEGPQNPGRWPVLRTPHSSISPLMSALSTHYKRIKREAKTEKNKEERENLNKRQKLERSKNKSLDQAKIDPLRQRQQLDAIDQTQA